MDEIKEFKAWDPLSSESDPGILVAAQRREIRNILKSYTGYYDLFAELVQNSLDAVERRLGEGEEGYDPAIWIRINIPESEVAVTDNGCGC
jgi:DNA gyrase/topoisomerase IV subunit B